MPAAAAAGFSDAIIGLTVVAAGTSMPELAASLIAARRKQPDIALGNIVGSNVFNLLGILGVSSLISPLRAEGIARVDLLVMLAFSALLFPIIWTGRRFERWEGATLVAGYDVYPLAPLAGVDGVAQRSYPASTPIWTLASALTEPGAVAVSVV